MRFANFKSFPSHGIDVSIDYHLEAAQGEMADKSFVLYHGANPILTQALLDAGSHDLVVTGHDHRAQMRYHNIRGREVLHVNPGTVAGTYLHCVTRPSCAIYDTKEHAAKFIHFDFQTPKKKYFIDI